MFTGIVAAVGKIVALEPIGAVQGGLRLAIDAGELDLGDVRIGDSIAINGACMTVIESTERQFVVDVSRESLRIATGLDRPGPVNLEKALTLQERLGGHLVSGHVDGIGEIVGFEPASESRRLVIRTGGELARFFAYKGSVVINGVSLTINEVEDGDGFCLFRVNVIPHTLAVTTLGQSRIGDRVNIEVDMLARYVDRILDASLRHRAG